MAGRLKMVAFLGADQELGRALLNSGGVALHLAGKLRCNEWMGSESAEFLLDDAAPAEQDGRPSAE